MGWFQ